MPPPVNRPSKRGSKYSKKINPLTFYVAYEGIGDEKEYFEALSRSISKRFRNLLNFIPVPKSSTDSAPSKVVADLVSHLDKDSINLNTKNTMHIGFIVIDTDHHFTGAHNRSTQESLRLCKQKGIQIIITNPCFELWLICHLEDISSKDTEFKASLLSNNKSMNRTFSKAEYSKLKGSKGPEELIKLLPQALENEERLNKSCDTQDQLPPTQLYSGVGRVINQMIEAGFII